jgi:KUP system potassium uptake protein
MTQTSSDRRRLALLALGVVYGDIGTSPLYAFRTALAIAPEMAEPANVLGVLSLIVWALIIVVCIKYCAVILKADNRGEGGVLALSTLVLSGRVPWGRPVLGIFGMLGAALFFADGALTPAISVLSAVEGLTVNRPDAQFLVVPITLVILVMLFRLQARGTAKVGNLFGPVMVLWFTTLAVAGIAAIANEPRVLLAVDPRWGVSFLATHRDIGLAVVAAVFLVVTGGEALYADLGHFGKGAIRLAWYWLVMPALVLNYLGQGALVLAAPDTRDNPFFLMVPEFLLSPLVLLATAATVIASQAAVSGVFSVVHQAVRLGYLPRMKVEHSSAKTYGQVFVPAADVALGLATAGLVLAFGSSGALAGAYGIAVSLVMAIATVLTLVWLIQRDSAVSRLLAFLMVAILAVDLVFCAANFTKLVQGGWVPIAAGAVVFLIMNTWTRGRAVVARQIVREHRSVRDLQQRLDSPHPPARAPGTAVYLASSPEGLPRALWHNLRYNNVVHERVILVTIMTEEVPRVSRDRRLEITDVLPGVVRIVARSGFMESPDITQVLYEASKEGVEYNPAETTFFVGNESVFYGRSPLTHWEKRLFAFLVRNSRPAASFYRVPDTRLVEIGAAIAV